MSTYVVGDIQGCLQPLTCLLENVHFNPDKDVLWSVGDIVNRGPESLESLRFLYRMRDNLIVVLGNHDLHLLAPPIQPYSGACWHPAPVDPNPGHWLRQ